MSDRRILEEIFKSGFKKGRVVVPPGFYSVDLPIQLDLPNSDVEIILDGCRIVKKDDSAKSRWHGLFYFYPNSLSRGSTLNIRGNARTLLSTNANGNPLNGRDPYFFEQAAALAILGDYSNYNIDVSCLNFMDNIADGLWLGGSSVNTVSIQGIVSGKRTRTRSDVTITFDDHKEIVVSGLSVDRLDIEPNSPSEKAGCVFLNSFNTNLLEITAKSRIYINRGFIRDRLTPQNARVDISNSLITLGRPIRPVRGRHTYTDTTIIAKPDIDLGKGIKSIIYTGGAQYDQNPELIELNSCNISSCSPDVKYVIQPFAKVREVTFENNTVSNGIELIDPSLLSGVTQKLYER